MKVLDPNHADCPGCLACYYEPAVFVTLPENTVGTDYVVGDIHGCFYQLDNLLDIVKFNERTDRLISVGDLVDRGPQSDQCLDWLREPWFFAVRGNHEMMCIDKVDISTVNENIMRSNGGGWFLALNAAQQKVYADSFRALPIAIEVMTPGGLVGIVHAECPLSDWTEFKTKLPHDEHLQTMTMWSRLRVRARSDQKIANVSMVISGHTPLDNVKVVGNSTFIDTGRCFKDGHFTILDITNDQLYSDRS